MADNQDVTMDLERVEVIQSDERWCTYLLADGNVLRVKLVLTSVSRVRGQLTPTGEPHYHFQSQVVSAIDRPPDPQT